MQNIKASFLFSKGGEKMSAVTPDTNLKLIKLDNELDSSNQLTFSNVQAQTTYFLGLTGLNVDYFTYQRKDSIIRYPAHIVTILEYNYVMYQNEHYDSKYFYAFITDMKYINDSMTEITIKTDVFQTWQFDFEIKKSFVERETVADDTVGKHTIPEGLQYGEYIQASISRVPTNDVMYLIQTQKFYHNGVERIATDIGSMPMARWFLCLRHISRSNRRASRLCFS